MSLEKYRQSVQDCMDCPLGGQSRLHVPGSGKAESRFLVLGEAPGAMEATIGIPFVGKSGQLLKNTFSSAGLDLYTGFITNTIKCRPPKNRDPLQSEMKACLPHTFTILQIVQPDILIVVGRIALNWVRKHSDINNYDNILELSGKIFPAVSILDKENDTTIVKTRVAVLMHPAYVLRGGACLLSTYRQQVENIVSALEE